MKDKKLYREKIIQLISQKKITYGMILNEYKKRNMEIHEDDEFEIVFDEGFYSEDNSWDGGFVLIVHRWRSHTPEELKKINEEFERIKKEKDKRDYQLYLQLKEKYEQ